MNHLRTISGISAITIWAIIASLGGSQLAQGADDHRVNLEIKLLGKTNCKPIKDASVYIKFKEKRRLRRDKKREWVSKTNREGRAVVRGVPEGTVLVQIVIPGWRPYGKFHKIKSPKHVLQIELERPPKWF